MVPPVFLTGSVNAEVLLYDTILVSAFFTGSRIWPFVRTKAKTSMISLLVSETYIWEKIKKASDLPSHYGISVGFLQFYFLSLFPLLQRQVRDFRNS